MANKNQLEQAMIQFMSCFKQRLAAEDFINFLEQENAQ